jgi:hypothetical protein
VSKNRLLIEEEGDWAVGHSVRVRKDAFRQEYSHYLPRIEQWWTPANAQIQISAFVRVEQHTKGNHKINSDLHCRECIDPSQCHEHAAVWQMSGDRGLYEKFCEDEPDIGSVCKFQMFIYLRPWWVVPQSPRTCQCVYHQNFDLIHEAYKAMMEKVHEECDCNCKFCEHGEGDCRYSSSLV